MAKIILKPHIKSIHGMAGGMVFYNVAGVQLVRRYSIPRNPRTEIQQANRSAFALAIQCWHMTTPAEKSFYERIAYGMNCSGYNLFISMRMRGITTSMLKLMNMKRQVPLTHHVPYMKAGTSVIPGAYYPDSCNIARTHTQDTPRPPGIYLTAA